MALISSGRHPHRHSSLCFYLPGRKQTPGNLCGLCLHCPSKFWKNGPVNSGRWDVWAAVGFLNPVVWDPEGGGGGS